MEILHRATKSARIFLLAAIAGSFAVTPLRAVDSEDVYYRTTSDWGAGLIGEFTISNDEKVDVYGWTLSFDFDGNITSVWGGEIVSHQGNHYVVKPLTWNQNLYPGAQTVFGFHSATGGITPKNFKLLTVEPTPGAPPPSFAQGQAGHTQVTWKIVNDWGAGLQADITLTNTGAQPVENWTLEMNFPRKITSIWNANIVSHQGDVYKISAANFDWNKTIPPGQSAKFGFIAEPGSLPNAPTTFHVNGLASTTPKGGTVPPPAPPSGAPSTPPPSAPPTPPPSHPLPTPAPPTNAWEFDYADVLRKSIRFYEAQRSGQLPANNRVPWRGHSALQDGHDVGIDLSGGYYDAGDHMKFALPLCSTLSTLAWGGIQYGDGYRRAGAWSELLEAVRWGTDWIIKAHPEPNVFYGQVGNGNADHSYWGPPERMTMHRPAYKIDATKPGTELAGEAAAALASASYLFRGTDSAYSAKLLEHARQLFTFADTHRGTYTDAIPDAKNFYNSFTSYHDEIAWAATWLYLATGEKAYLERAEETYDKHLKGTLIAWTHSWDDKRYGTAMLLGQITRKKVYQEDCATFLDYWTVGRNGRRVNYTPGGLAWLNQWGSLRYAANTAFLAFLYSDTYSENRDRYRDFAIRQMTYILGDNPAKRSYVVGFGHRPPVNPHHRAAHGSTNGSITSPQTNRHSLDGALVGGPSSPDDYAYQDDRTNYITNEVALDYNAGFSGALAKMVLIFGNRP